MRTSTAERSDRVVSISATPLQASMAIATGEVVIKGARTTIAAEQPAFREMTSTRALSTRE